MIYSEKQYKELEEKYKKQLAQLKKENEIKEKENRLLKQQNKQKDRDKSATHAPRYPGTTRDIIRRG